jgi:lipid-A-disaccharide synthase
VRPTSVFLVAGEESGDQLGAGLMRALKAEIDNVTFAGVGGGAMAREGLGSLFPPVGYRRHGHNGLFWRGFRPSTVVVSRWSRPSVRAKPDVLVIIDSPEFTHAVARRVRRRLPGLPIVNYVSPSVWAWRPGRAPRMRAYVDHVLALKPFEPAAHQRLGGPPCTYVGHPLVEQLEEIRPRPGERPSLASDPITLLVLPGSRRSEISRLMEPFGAALGL